MPNFLEIEKDCPIINHGQGIGEYPENYDINDEDFKELQKQIKQLFKNFNLLICQYKDSPSDKWEDWHDVISPEETEKILADKKNWIWYPNGPGYFIIEERKGNKVEELLGYGLYSYSVEVKPSTELDYLKESIIFNTFDKVYAQPTTRSELDYSTVHTYPTGLQEFAPIDLSEGLYDEDRLIQGDYTGISFPVIFKQDSGKKLQDMLNTSWPNLYLISDRMKVTLEENQLTGWKTFKVEVFDKKGEIIKGYHGFSVIGKCGPVDFNRSFIIEKRLILHGPLVKFYKGLYPELATWDGNDFFIPKNYFSITVTQRTAEVLQKNKLTNISLGNLAECEIKVD
eukprot:gene1373-1734_t